MLLKDVKPGGLFSWGIEPGQDTCIRLALLFEKETIVVDGVEMEHPNAESQRALWDGYAKAADLEGFQPWEVALVALLATGDVCLASLDTEVEPVEESS